MAGALRRDDAGSRQHTTRCCGINLYFKADAQRGLDVRVFVDHKCCAILNNELRVGKRRHDAQVFLFDAFWCGTRRETTGGEFTFSDGLICR